MIRKKPIIKGFAAFGRSKRALEITAEDERILAARARIAHRRGRGDDYDIIKISILPLSNGDCDVVFQLGDNPSIAVSLSRSELHKLRNKITDYLFGVQE